MVHVATTIEDEEDEKDEKKERREEGEEEEEEGQILQPYPQPQPTSVLLYLHYYVPLFHTVIHAPLARVFQNSDRWSVTLCKIRQGTCM